MRVLKDDFIDRFPNTNLFNIPTIAPLWADFDFSEVGSIYYRVTDDPVTLKDVRDMVTDFNEELLDYRPSLAVVVTWFEAERYVDTSGVKVISYNNRYTLKYGHFGDR